MVNQLLRKKLEYELISSSDAAEILEISKQRFLVIAKDKGLQPIHKSTLGNLYLRADIEKIKQGDIEVKRKKPLLFFTGYTRECINKFNEIFDGMKEISHIFVYFSDFDAVLDGFYVSSENNLGELKDLESAHFIVRDIEGNEFWFTGLNCGYLGEGPSGSEQVLKEIGIENELASMVRDGSYDIVKYFRNELGKFEVYGRKSTFKRVGNTNAKLCTFKNRLVCLENKRYILRNADNSLEFLHEYSSFIPNLRDVIFFNSKDIAKEYGYSIQNIVDPYETVYQVILRDESGRELWLTPSVFNDKELKYQTNVKEILEYCGITINEPDKSLPQKFKDWLNKNPKIIPYEILEIENRKI